MDFTPIAQCPDWVVIFRAQFAPGRLGQEAIETLMRRGLRLAAEPERAERLILARVDELRTRAAA